MRLDDSTTAAAVATVEALKRAGRLEDIDAALVSGFLSIATALDDDPSNASLWRQFRDFEAALRTTGAAAHDNDLVALLAKVGDPPAA
jgi:hypothetical protein